MDSFTVIEDRININVTVSRNVSDKIIPWLLNMVPDLYQCFGFNDAYWNFGTATRRTFLRHLWYNDGRLEYGVECPLIEWLARFYRTEKAGPLNALLSYMTLGLVHPFSVGAPPKRELTIWFIRSAKAVDDMPNKDLAKLWRRGENNRHVLAHFLPLRFFPEIISDKDGVTPWRYVFEKRMKSE